MSTPTSTLPVAYITNHTFHTGTTATTQGPRIYVSGSGGTSSTISMVVQTSSNGPNITAMSIPQPHIPPRPQSVWQIDNGHSYSMSAKEWMMYASGHRRDLDADDIIRNIENSLVFLTMEDGNISYIETEQGPERLAEAINKMVFLDGQEVTLTLPDKSILRLNKDASYTIEDEHCNIQYRANRKRVKNRFIEGSDLLEEFLLFLKDCNLSKDHALNKITVRNFIEWIIVEAAKEDGDPTPDYYPTEQSLTLQVAATSMCKHCGDTLSNEHQKLGINFCNGNHMDLYLAENIK